MKNSARVNSRIFFSKFCVVNVAGRRYTKCVRTTLMLLLTLQRDYSSLATIYRQVNSANVQKYTETMSGSRARVRADVH